MIQLTKYFWSKSKTHNECSRMIEVLNASKRISLDHFNTFIIVPWVDFKDPRMNRVVAVINALNLIVLNQSQPFDLWFWWAVWNLKIRSWTLLDRTSISVEFALNFQWLCQVFYFGFLSFGRPQFEVRSTELCFGRSNTTFPKTKVSTLFQLCSLFLRRFGRAIQT